MIQARVNVFETNSSSTHNCTIMSDNDYQAFIAGDVYINKSWISSDSEFADKDLVTKEEIVDIVKKSKSYKKDGIELERCVKDAAEFDECLNERLEGYFLNYDYCGCDLEHDEHTFTTEHGDVVHVMCDYGYDG